MTAAHFEDHPTDPDKVILRKPPRIDQGPDYERGFVDGMQHQMQSSVDKAVNRMAQPEQKPVAFYVYKPTLPRGHLGNVSDGDLPWVYDQDPSSGYSARMLVYTTPPQRKWVGLMRGVRVEGDTVVISVKGGNEAARELCGALVGEMNR